VCGAALQKRTGKIESGTTRRQKIAKKEPIKKILYTDMMQKMSAGSRRRHLEGEKWLRKRLQNNRRTTVDLENATQLFALSKFFVERLHSNGASTGCGAHIVIAPCSASIVISLTLYASACLCELASKMSSKSERSWAGVSGVALQPAPL
jgi:hypothetical protein